MSVSVRESRSRSGSDDGAGAGRQRAARGECNIENDASVKFGLSGQALNRSKRVTSQSGIFISLHMFTVLIVPGVKVAAEANVAAQQSYLGLHQRTRDNNIDEQPETRSHARTHHTYLSLSLPQPYLDRSTHKSLRRPSLVTHFDRSHTFVFHRYIRPLATSITDSPNYPSHDSSNWTCLQVLHRMGFRVRMAHSRRDNNNWELILAAFHTPN
ncbi:hypothetical protein BDV93DRAFT_514995 [Ceratobasidium sp. AG-I]|nr:hypothetical protein BDV93DRAFT_514995 [Ceratobasidium sp. AG-I]